MSGNPDDELVPEQTQGFRVGEKKTIDEYQQLGKHFRSWRFRARRKNMLESYLPLIPA